MAAKLFLWLGGLGGFLVVGSMLFDARDKQVQQTLLEKRYSEAPNEAARKKLMFMSALQNAALTEKPIYRQTKEDIENSQPRKF